MTFDEPESDPSNHCVRRLLLLAVTIALLLALAIAAVGIMASEGAIRVQRQPIPAGCPLIPHAFCEAVEIPGAGGDTQRAWFFTPSAWNGKAILQLHGIGDSRVSQVPFAQLYTGWGYAVLLPDLRGHGTSAGLVTYGVLERADVHHWADWLFKQKNVHELNGLGISLGGAVLLQAMPVEPRLRTVIAESPYTDFRGIANERLARLSGPPLSWCVPAVVASGIINLRWHHGVDLNNASPLQAVQALHRPVLLIHGDADRNTAPANSERLLAANPALVRLWRVPGATHANAWSHSQIAYERIIHAWFTQLSW